MITIRNRSTAAVLAAATFALAGGAHAAPTAGDAPAPPGPPPAAACAPCPRGAGPLGAWGHRPHAWAHRMHGAVPWPWMHALDLTGAQRRSAQAIGAAARADFRDLHEKMRANSDKLRASSPDDPGHAALVAEISRADGALFAQTVVKREEVRTKLYALLTPAQKAKLAQMRARAAGRHERGCDAP